MKKATPGSKEKVNIEDSNNMVDKEIRASLIKGKLPCAVAFKIAEKAGVTTGTVGDRTDKLDLRIVKCQLGCFDVEKAKRPGLDAVKIETELTKVLQDSMVNQQLTCFQAFEIAGKTKASRMHIGDATTKLKIRLIECQLGCF
ncbi:MAG: hypothetical protein Q8P44_07495 [Dehalococcoidia bacterium]|nr:hypothetical protein [Dehalococcoidia bacterium]